MNKITGMALAAIAVTFVLACEQHYEQYQKQNVKAKWVEVKLSMPQIVTLQTSYKALSGSYGTTFQEIGFSMTEHQRYSYFMADDALKGFVGPAELPEDLPYPEVTSDSFTVYAVANLDDDPDLDVWRIDQNRSIRQLRNDQN